MRYSAKSITRTISAFTDTHLPLCGEKIFLGHLHRCLGVQEAAVAMGAHGLLLKTMAPQYSWVKCITKFFSILLSIIQKQDVLVSIDRAIEFIHLSATQKGGSLTHEQRNTLQYVRIATYKSLKNSFQEVFTCQCKNNVSPKIACASLKFHVGLTFNNFTFFAVFSASRHYLAIIFDPTLPLMSF